MQTNVDVVNVNRGHFLPDFLMPPPPENNKIN